MSLLKSVSLCVVLLAASWLAAGANDAVPAPCAMGLRILESKLGPEISEHALSLMVANSKRVDLGALCSLSPRWDGLHPERICSVFLGLSATEIEAVGRVSRGVTFRVAQCFTPINETPTLPDYILSEYTIPSCKGLAVSPSASIIQQLQECTSDHTFE
jgi:hypothetical protein